MEQEQNVYQENGYKNRRDYLKCMAEDYGAPLETVHALASVLGPEEDFDGLIVMLEDYADSMTAE